MKPELDWTAIDHVFFDMDGTLLDLHFDNHFWLEHVPKRYAEISGIPEATARAELKARYDDIGGTLEWYCIDHWSQALGLDIALLKEEVSHLIAVHPHVLDFLNQLQRHKKQLALVTNAHQKSLALKMEKTQLAGHFHHVISAHDLGHAKEEEVFWECLKERVFYDPERTLFIDDNAAVLRSAQAYGIRWLLAILNPDSQLPTQKITEFPAVHNFSELLDNDTALA
jgi:putative hydrolase of the HAD superfamily